MERRLEKESKRVEHKFKLWWVIKFLRCETCDRRWLEELDCRICELCWLSLIRHRVFYFFLDESQSILFRSSGRTQKRHLEFGVTNQTAMSYCCVQRDKMNINSYKMHMERFKNEPFGTFRFYFLLIIFFIFYEYW